MSRLKSVLNVTSALLDLGISEVSIGERLVSPHRPQSRLFFACLAVDPGESSGGSLSRHQRYCPCKCIGRHATRHHDNDSSSGGLGGCGYAPGAAGNLATEDLLYMFDGMNIKTGVDFAQVAEASITFLDVLGKRPTSKYLQAYITNKGQSAA